MREPSTPANEIQRLRALRDLDILDSAPEERFERLTRIAKSYFGVPIALISLIDSTRQWFKSCQGLDSSETPRRVSFCGHAILSDDVLYVPDASMDERFADNPLVSGPPHLRFYAGRPLKSVDGFRLGTLCLIDSEPRVLSEDQFEVLEDLASCVEHELHQVPARRAAVALKKSQAHLQAVLDTVLDGIITIDEMGIILTANPATEKIFGYQSTELEGRNVKVLMPDSYALEHDGYLSAYRETGEAKVIGIGREVLGRRKDETEFPLELSVAEMSYGGQRYFVGIVRDISDRKKIEEMKNEFISTVSHELRTPLTSIRGALSLVLGKAKEEFSPKVLRMLESANRNSERLTYLINDILDLEKIESGLLAFEFRGQDLNALSWQALESSEGYASKHSVNLEFESSAERPLVWGDEHRLLQVFSNLISNAVKYSAPGGVVMTRVSAEEDQYRVSVRDHGRGIPDDFRNRIFQRFAQADSSDTREKGGTGLGLSITKAIVERHGGQIDYLSELGHGTEFYFLLPRWSEVSMGDGKAGEPAEVLICEDDPDVAFVLRNLLEEEGLSCDVAGTAASARELVGAGSYRLLLLDLTLPDADGLELLQELRSAEASANLPVIIISGRADESRTRFDGDAMQVADWIQKPLDQGRLSSALRRALGRDGRARVLHVEDNRDVLEYVRLLLEDTVEVEHATTLSEAHDRISEAPFDLVILDLTLADGSGLDLLQDAELKDTPVMIFSGEETDIVNRQIVAALTKAKTSNERLVRTIKSILNRP